MPALRYSVTGRALSSRQRETPLTWQAHLEDRSFTIAILESAVEGNQMVLLLLLLIKLARKLCGFLEAERGGCGWGRCGGGGAVRGGHNGIAYANVLI